MLFPVQVLISEDSDLPIKPSLVDFTELLVAEVIAQCYAAYLRADMWRQTINLYGLVPCYRCHERPPTKYSAEVVARRVKEVKGGRCAYTPWLFAQGRFRWKTK